MNINLQIAEERKLKEQFDCLRLDDVTGKLYACDIIGEMPTEECVEIDFIKNPALTQELIIELGKAGWMYRLHPTLEEHFWLNGDGTNTALNEDFGIAVAMAYCKEKGL